MVILSLVRSSITSYYVSLPSRLAAYLSRIFLLADWWGEYVRTEKHPPLLQEQELAPTATCWIEDDLYSCQTEGWRGWIRRRSGGGSSLYHLLLALWLKREKLHILYASLKLWECWVLLVQRSNRPVLICVWSKLTWQLLQESALFKFCDNDINPCN